MKLTRYVIGAAVPIVLLFLGLGQQVQAYWGPFGNGWNGNDPFKGWMGGGGLEVLVLFPIDSVKIDE